MQAPHGRYVGLHIQHILFRIDSEAINRHGVQRAPGGRGRILLRGDRVKVHHTVVAIAIRPGAPQFLPLQIVPSVRMPEAEYH